MSVQGLQTNFAQVAFNNYMDKKKGGEGVNRKFMLGHVNYGRNYVKCQQVSTQGRLGSKLKFGPRSC